MGCPGGNPEQRLLLRFASVVSRSWEWDKGCHRCSHTPCWPRWGFWVVLARGLPLLWGASMRVMGGGGSVERREQVSFTRGVADRLPIHTNHPCPVNPFKVILHWSMCALEERVVCLMNTDPGWPRRVGSGVSARREEKITLILSSIGERSYSRAHIILMTAAPSRTQHAEWIIGKHWTWYEAWYVKLDECSRGAVRWKINDTIMIAVIHHNVVIVWYKVSHRSHPSFHYN